ncbi:MAG: SDR family oxidoreductase [Alphaproteobacteria bacterium]|nr:SDR family oxidoreductase [Alphaproteobacteria bacterium]
MRLKDKVAVVTGAAGGIGRAVAERFVKEGAKVVICDIDDKAGDAAAKAIGALYVHADTGSRKDADALIAAAVKAHGRLDILVNNAGIVHACDFLELSEEDFDRVLRVNLKGYFLCGQAAARQMVKQGSGGNIIHMSSVNAVMAIPNITSYVVSKGGVNQLTRAMSLALVDHGIRVNAIGPGSIATELLKKVMVDEAARARIMSRTPMGRAGDPAEVASVAVFLASDDASYITGQVIYPDGGRMGLNYTVPVKG